MFDIPAETGCIAASLDFFQPGERGGRLYIGLEPAIDLDDAIPLGIVCREVPARQPHLPFLIAVAAGFGVVDAGYLPGGHVVQRLQASASGFRQFG